MILAQCDSNLESEIELDLNIVGLPFRWVNIILAFCPKHLYIVKPPCRLLQLTKKSLKQGIL